MTLQMSCKNEGKKLVGLTDDEEEKWLKYYSSHHQILLVGEGDFSFSLCLAQSFGSACNIIASSLDIHDELVRKYKKAMSNLIALTKLGAYVLHGVDATQMKFHPALKMRRFDRIIFNFPHAGFHGREGSFSMIQKHKELIGGFFMNARSMLKSNGEVHINHKITAPFDAWCIPELGIQRFLWPIDCVEFQKEDYPGYNNKRGDGSRCDQPFPLGKCSTFKFVLLTKEESNPRNHGILSNHRYPLRSLSHQSSPSVISCRNGHLPMFGGVGYLNSEKGILGRASGYVGGPSRDLQRSCWPGSTEFRYPEIEYVRNMDMIVGKQVSGHVHGISCDLQRSSWPKSTEFRYHVGGPSRDLQRSCWPGSTEFRYPEIEYVRNMDMIVGKQVSGHVHGISCDLQRSSWPKSTEFRYPQTEHVRNMDMILGKQESGYVDESSCDLQRSLWLESTVFRHPKIEHVRNMDMILGKHVFGYVHGMSSDLQRSSWPESTEFRYPETEHVRNMDMIRRRSFSEYVGGISSDLRMRSRLESRNVMCLGTDKVRDEYGTLRPYHATSWF